VARAEYADGARHIHKERALIGPDGLPPRVATSIPFTACRDLEERLWRLFEMAYSDIASCGPHPAGRWSADLVLSRAVARHPGRDGLLSRLRAHDGGLDVTVSYGGAAEALSRVAGAARRVEEGEADALLVGSVDSLLPPETLDLLWTQHRVLTRDNPYGLIPGEAACLLLVAHPAVMGDARALGRVDAAFEAREDEDVAAPRGILGRGLAAVLRPAGAHRPPSRWMLDLNGERWRAEELGFAVAAAGAPVTDLAADLETPSLYLGDTGAAMGAVMPALALGDPPRRGHPRRGPVSLISAASYEGARAAIFVERIEEGTVA
jgi:3-oxoacyl-[acyl-carrier-protein] synthase-1